MMDISTPEILTNVEKISRNPDNSENGNFNFLIVRKLFEIVHSMKNKKLPKEESAMKNLANVCT